MKKITSELDIVFKIDGNTTLNINKDGCIATDEHAKILVERLGGNITVEDTTVEEAVETVLGEEVIEPKEVEGTSTETPVEDTTVEEAVETPKKVKKTKK